MKLDGIIKEEEAESFCPKKVSPNDVLMSAARKIAFDEDRNASFLICDEARIEKNYAEIVAGAMDGIATPIFGGSQKSSLREN